MKKNYSHKPIRECIHCELNLGTECALFDNPASKWKRRKCEGFNNPEYIAMYEKAQHPHGAYARKIKRAQKARLAATVDHHDGRHRPGHTG